jgi:hypothetical protein
VDYKVPTAIEFRTELPRNALGKVLRRVLRDEHERLRAGADRRVTPSPAPSPSATPSPRGTAFVAELERLARLHESGALSADEFEVAKARLLEH